jgi:hypothetical protein
VKLVPSLEEPIEIVVSNFIVPLASFTGADEEKIRGLVRLRWGLEIRYTTGDIQIHTFLISFKNKTATEILSAYLIKMHRLYRRKSNFQKWLVKKN